MTHFTVGVIVPGPRLPDLHSFIERQMAPYDESLEIEPYVSYSPEKAEADLSRDRSRLERIIERQDATFDLDKCRQHLETLRAATPEERYREYLASHERFSDEGEPESTYNPDSKWDWYVIGGRWDGWLFDRETTGEAVGDNMTTTEDALARDKLTHAVITPDGEWHEHGQMGWFGVMLTENESWEPDQKSLLSRYPGHHIVLLDAHI